MNKPLDITGDRYGNLVAIERVQSSGRRTMWKFICDCGEVCTKRLENVRGGITRSCGCILADITRQRSLTHGHSIGRKQSRTLKSYQHAKSRCYNPNDPKYPIYGGRGISMCQRWIDDFQNFLDDMGEAPAGLTIDRINPNGNYEPSNCRWATPFEQARTRTDNVIVEYNGEKMILKDFAKAVNVNYKSLHSYMRKYGLDHISASKICTAGFVEGR